MATLPARAADALRPVLPRLADDIIAAIAAEVPVYARPMEGRFGRGDWGGLESCGWGVWLRHPGVLHGPEAGPPAHSVPRPRFRASDARFFWPLPPRATPVRTHGTTSLRDGLLMPITGPGAP